MDSLWGQAYALCANDLIVIFPHAVHSIEQGSLAGGKYFNVMFHPSLFQGSEQDLCYDKYLRPFLTGEKTMDFFNPSGSPFNQAVPPCILSLLEHRADRYTTYELMIKSSLFFLLHQINQYCIAADGGNNTLQLSYGRLKNALYDVQKFFDREISIHEAAERCGLSESHFMKLFKDFTGMSFNAYLVDYRLNLAAKQLAETNFKVIDIAENCGFHNHSYFTRAFQKKYRKTPVAYRKAIKKLEAPSH